jgi:DNA repair exonuclease SbcCD ATPase subunit
MALQLDAARAMSCANIRLGTHCDLTGTPRKPWMATSVAQVQDMLDKAKVKAEDMEAERDAALARCGEMRRETEIAYESRNAAQERANTAARDMEDLRARLGEAAKERDRLAQIEAAVIANGAVGSIEAIRLAHAERDALRARLGELRDAIRRDLGWDSDKNSEAQASDWRKLLHVALANADAALPNPTQKDGMP